MAAFSLLHPLCLPRMHSFCKEVHSPGVGIFFHYGCICIHYYIFFLLFLSQKLKGKLCFPSFPIIQVNNMSTLWKLSSLKMASHWSLSVVFQLLWLKVLLCTQQKGHCERRFFKNCYMLNLEGNTVVHFVLPSHTLSI